MKTFSQFQEDIDSMKATMKGFADTMVPHMKKFAKSKEAKDLKTNVMNMFIDKGNNHWTSTYADRATYTSQAKAKAETYIWDKKTNNGWDLTAVNEG